MKKSKDITKWNFISIYSCNLNLWSRKNSCLPLPLNSLWSNPILLEQNQPIHHELIHPIIYRGGDKELIRRTGWKNPFTLTLSTVVLTSSAQRCISSVLRLWVEVIPYSSKYLRRIVFCSGVNTTAPVVKKVPRKRSNQNGWNTHFLLQWWLHESEDPWAKSRGRHALSDSAPHLLLFVV